MDDSALGQNQFRQAHADLQGAISLAEFGHRLVSDWCRCWVGGVGRLLLSTNNQGVSQAPLRTVWLMVPVPPSPSAWGGFGSASALGTQSRHTDEFCRPITFASRLVWRGCPAQSRCVSPVVQG